MATKKTLARRIRKLETKAVFEPGKHTANELAENIAGFIYIGSKVGDSAAGIKKKAQSLRPRLEEIQEDPDKNESVALAHSAASLIVSLMGFIKWALDAVERSKGELPNNAVNLKELKRAIKEAGKQLSSLRMR